MPEERKLVTVLFADIVGSTALGRAHDPEVVRESLARTFEGVREVLEAHGGTVEKFIGDAVMAVFGVPTAHDDDADRAVRAAFALRARVAELSRHGLPFEVRIGVNTGEAVTGTGTQGHFLVTGPVVNVGARLEQAASAGEILVGPLTRSVTDGTVRYDAPREIEAKGVGRVEASSARELASAVPEQRRGIEGLRAPLIGRDRELRLLREAFERVAAERAPSLITIFGAAGAGKSRLVIEFVSAVGEERVRVGRCLPYGEGITFHPIQQIVRADAGIDLAMPRAEALVALRSAVERALGTGEAETVARRLEVVLGLAEAPQALPEVATNDLMEELRWGVRRYFERRAAAPLVLVFEDVHWAEQALIDLIEHLAEWTRAPLLVVCLARPDFREIRPTFGAAAGNAVAITLSPLGPDDTRLLIRELLAIDALSEDVRAGVVTRAEGNPLYVEEFLRTLIETKRIERREGRWVATGEIDVAEVPPSLQGLITARLDRVTPDVKRLLQAASIVGRLFSTTALAAIAGTAPSADLLREAARRDLIVEADERAPGEGRVHRFKHPLFRDVAYATIPKSERLRMHDSYARWLEATLGERAEEVREIVGYHAEQAYLYARELSRPTASALGAGALALLVAAADRARLRSDAHASWKLYERAAGIADAIGADAPMRAHARGFALLGRFAFEPPDEEMEDALAQAMALARTAGPTEVLVELLTWSAIDAFNRQGDTEKAKRLAAEIPDLARATGDTDLLALALTRCGLLAYWWNDRELEERLYLAAVDAGRRGRRVRSVAMPLGWLASRAERFAGDFARGAEYERELAAIDLGSSPLAQMFRSRVFGRNAFMRGDFAEALTQAQRALIASQETGIPHHIALNEWIVGEALLATGDAARARALLEHGAEVMQRRQQRGQIPELSARAARACLRLGDREAARRHVAAAKGALLQPDLESLAITAIAEAELAAADGDVASAEQILRDALTRIEPSQYGFDIAMLQLSLGELLLGQSRLTEARAELAKVRAFFRDPLARGWQEKIDALLARAEAPVG
jgi:class 3 adenylate cyclase/tetratricopeptide (TPR) repeat protein